MDEKLLAVFDAISRTGNLSKVADMVGTSQPAVSLSL